MVLRDVALVGEISALFFLVYLLSGDTWDVELSEDLDQFFALVFFFWEIFDIERARSWASAATQLLARGVGTRADFLKDGLFFSEELAYVVYAFVETQIELHVERLVLLDQWLQLRIVFYFFVLLVESFSLS